MPYKDRAVALSGYACAGCGCPLTLQEIFACRLRGLKKPVCLGCLVSVLVFVRKQLLPMFDDLHDKIIELAEEAAAGR